MAFPSPVGWVPSEELTRMMMNGDFQTDPNEPIQYSFGAGYATPGQTPEQLIASGQGFQTPARADMSYYYLGGAGDPQQIYSNADYNAFTDDQRTRALQGTARVGALVGGAAALGATPWGSTTPGYGSATVSGTTTSAGIAPAAADGLAPITVGAQTLPGGVPAVDAAFAGGMAGSAPYSLPAAISSPSAINAFTGVGAGGNVLSRWLPHITSGVNSLLGYRAADSAADAEVNALNAGIAEQRRQYDADVARMQPWVDSGTDALRQLNDPRTSFAASPGYEWMRNEGMRDIGNSFSARGGAQSGNALRALSEFTTGLAQQDYGNWWNQQSQRAGLGQNAVNNVTNIGQNTSANVSNMLSGQGVSRASGVLGKYGSLAQGLNNGVSNWLYRRRLN